MARKIKFDLQGIREIADRYKEYGEEMGQIADKLQETMNTLVSKDWKGKASMALKKAVGDDWCKTVIRYVELMRNLQRVLHQVTATYEEILREARALDIDL